MKNIMINKYKYYVYSLVVATVTMGFGQSIQELQEMRDEYKKFQKEQGQVLIPQIGIEGIEPATGLPREAQMIPYLPEKITEQEKSTRHFGYDFFTRRDSVAFWENLPTPANYLLGPGDELIISLWGETQLRETYIISREGKIYDEKVGLLNISGRTISEASDYLKTQFGRIYATLNSKKASTFIDISLGELRSINVN
ncbi:uncharacterized protein METZ01_LOCUS428653, partial [marine metagenome]